MSIAKKSGYQLYLEELHSKVNTPDDIISNVIKEATGNAISQKVRVIAGEANEVYQVTLTNNVQVFLRISRKDKPDFEQECWAINEAKKIGILVPDVLLIKHLITEAGSLSFCVQRKVDGDVLDRGEIDWDKLTRETQRKYINQAGELLSKIHSIKTNGFGPIDKNGKGNFQTYNDFLLQNVKKSKEYLDIANKFGFDEKIIKVALKIIMERAGKQLSTEPVLTHGDYGAKHIMVKKDKITGIIDWGEASGCTPIYELARWDYWFGDEIPTKWLVEGYANKVNLRGWQEEIRWISLDRGLEVLSWYSNGIYPKAVNKAVTKLTRDLEYFS